MTTTSMRWFAVTFIALLLTQGGVTAVRALYEPSGIRAPRESVTNLPVDLGDWQAAEDAAGNSGMDEKMLAAVWADDAVTRFYRHRDGLSCSVHLAMWHKTDEWMPHPPSMCYPGAGYSPVQNQTIALPGLDDVKIGSTRYQNTATGQAVLIMYWYQMGNRHYMDRNASRDVRRSFWGGRERPPLVKVLMQINDTDNLGDQAQMAELASQVYQFVNQI